MIKKFYYWIHRKFSKPAERDEYSSGHWQNMIRETAMEFCGFSEGRMIELGCGEGLFLEKIVLGNSTAKVFGLDIWMDILRKARKRMDGKGVGCSGLVQSDASSIPFGENLFDTIVCINVFFNLPSQEIVEACLEEAARTCKPGGRIILDIRNALNPLLYVKYKLAKYYDETTRNLPMNTYRLGGMTASLAAHGFQITRQRNIGFPGNIFAPIIVLEARKT